MSREDSVTGIVLYLGHSLFTETMAVELHRAEIGALQNQGKTSIN